MSCTKQSVSHTHPSIPVTPFLSLELTAKKGELRERKEGMSRRVKAGRVERGEEKQRRDSKTERTGTTAG